eukprot:GHVS01000381.1.p1 GENE.GHVS01000381.1~~GHVS01000381.1.p1  ORF type:complete len:416 (+),score=31.83 GHVS01000381.1:259-1506(+)
MIRTLLGLLAFLGIAGVPALFAEQHELPAIARELNPTVFTQAARRLLLAPNSSSFLTLSPKQVEAQGRGRGGRAVTSQHVLASTDEVAATGNTDNDGIHYGWAQILSSSTDSRCVAPTQTPDGTATNTTVSCTSATYAQSVFNTTVFNVSQTVDPSNTLGWEDEGFVQCDISKPQNVTLSSGVVNLVKTWDGSAIHSTCSNHTYEFSIVESFNFYSPTDRNSIEQYEKTNVELGSAKTAYSADVTAILATPGTSNQNRSMRTTIMVRANNQGCMSVFQYTGINLVYEETGPYSPWQDWSSCSTSCQTSDAAGTQCRIRYCKTNEGTSCSSQDMTQSMPCVNVPPCDGTTTSSASQGMPIWAWIVIIIVIIVVVLAFAFCIWYRHHRRQQRRQQQQPPEGQPGLNPGQVPGAVAHP